MEAFKFLRHGRVGPFSGTRWPAPGEWLGSDGSVELCRSGVHALTEAVLPRWISEELWRVELEDAEDAGDGLLLARRGRLVEHVAAWNDATAREFAEACAARLPSGGPPLARARAADIALDLPKVTAGPRAAELGYMAAHAAEAVSPGGYAAERRRQAEWLVERLGLARG